LAKYDVVKAEHGHIPHIAANMRDADKIEIWYSSASTPTQALLNGLNESEKCYTVLVDGVPTLMFGVVERCLLDRTGTVWMLGTDDIHKIKFGRREFSIMWRKVLELVKGYNIVDNYVHVDNETSIKWLEFMGFTFSEPAPMGLFGEPFRHFEMRIH